MLKRILEVSADTIGVERVSVWRYADDRTRIDCLDLFERGNRRHSGDIQLLARDFPDYFRAIAECEIVAVDDAREDPRTKAFAPSYLAPLDIWSMMDVPIHVNGEVMGVICHEQTGCPRRWEEDEMAFALAAANLIALVFERCERFRAEAALQLQSAALDAAADAIVITDTSGAIVWVNPAFSALTGYAAGEALGRNPRELLRSGVQEPAFYHDLWRTISAGAVWRGEIVNRRKDGTCYHEEQSITPVTQNGRTTHYVAIKRDLTARRELERQFLHAQKLQVVGQLAGGIAHDFNNVLTVINGTAELARLDLAPDNGLHLEFERIQAAGTRAATLAKRLLRFSRKDIGNEPREHVVVGAIVNDLRVMLQRLIGEDIQLDVASSDEGTPIVGDTGEIEQVILNLAANARDAMPRGGGLRIVSSVVGSSIELAVSDTGSGMSAELQSRIFEPYFTTKDAGHGTGLGLATVLAIVTSHGGTINVDSSVGRGTTFTIRLPIAVPSAAVGHRRVGAVA